MPTSVFPKTKTAQTDINKKSRFKSNFFFCVYRSFCVCRLPAALLSCFLTNSARNRSTQGGERKEKESFRFRKVMGALVGWFFFFRVAAARLSLFLRKRKTSSKLPIILLRRRVDFGSAYCVIFFWVPGCLLFFSFLPPPSCLGRK